MGERASGEAEAGVQPLSAPSGEELDWALSCVRSRAFSGPASGTLKALTPAETQAEAHRNSQLSQPSGTHRNSQLSQPSETRLRPTSDTSSTLRHASETRVGAPSLF